MSRNLGKSSCVECNYGPVRITDLAGKPLEFRRYAKFRPEMGVHWDCPDCGTAYFAYIRMYDKFWAQDQLTTGEWKQDYITLPNGTLEKNKHKGKFAYEARTLEFLRKPGDPATTTMQTGCFVIDLSYYESFNDEPLYDRDDTGLKEAIRDGSSPPYHLCTDGAEDVQWVW